MKIMSSSCDSIIYARNVVRRLFYCSVRVRRRLVVIEHILCKCECSSSWELGNLEQMGHNLMTC